MSKLKIKWNSERIVSLSAMSISVMTLVIFIYQTDLMSKQNYISILPYLQVSTSNNQEEQRYSLNLVNHGVGPAIIESVTMIYGGERRNLEAYNDNFYTYLVSIKPQMDSISYYSNSTLNKGIAIPTNAVYNVFEVKNSTKDYNLLLAVMAQLQEEGLRFEVVYKSIQNERWIIHSDSNGPIKID
ncbi:MAG: hypothetical protein KJN75_00735 [Muriicola sp.]|nr:hypothetical protein [Muriicola sp.]